MLILIHVLIALTSVAYTTYLIFSPNKSRFYNAYGLIALTLGSGTYLVISSHAPILSSCVTGLAYIFIVTTGTVIAHHRLVKSEVNDQ